MAKFIFSLDSLKKLRSHRMSIAKREFTRIQAQVFSLQDQIEKLKFERRQSLGEISDSMIGSGTVNGMSFLISSISDKMKILEAKIEDLAPDVERHRRWMVEASRELKAIEILEEKRKQEFLFEQDKKEKRRIDQWSSESFARKMVAESNAQDGEEP